MPMVPVDTAIQVIVGPLIDDTDFKSLETGVAYNAAGMSVDLIKSSITGTPAKTDLTLTTAGSQDWVELGNGMYYIEITAAQNDTEGELQVVGVATGILPFISAKYQVVPTAVYNSLVAGSDTLQADVTQFGGTNGTFSGGRPEVNTTHAAGTAWGSGAITAASIAASALNGKGDWNVGKTGYSISGTKTTLDALNDVSAADVNAQVDTALADIGLDHLLSSALPTSWAVDVAAGSVFDQLADDGTESYNRTTDSLQAIRDRGDAAWPTATTVDLNADQSGVTVGTVNALGTTAKSDVNTEVDNALNTAIPGVPTAGSVNDVLNDLSSLLPVSGTLSTFDPTDALTEAYAADGAAASTAELLYMLWSAFSDFAISGTTITSKKLDGTTTAMTFTIDDGSNPTSRTRAT